MSRSKPGPGRTDAAHASDTVHIVAGAVLIIIALVLAPVVICVSFVAIAAALGQLLWSDGEKRHEGSELLDVGV